MLAALVAFLATQDAFVQHVDDLAKRRDVAGLTALVDSKAWKGRNPLDVIRTNGAYDTGRYGWSALSGKGPDGVRYVVLTTPLTSEDIGERLFVTDGQRLTKYVDEREDFGWRIENHGLTVRFEIPNKKVSIGDAAKVRTNGTNPLMMVRFGPNYKMKSVKAFTGETIQWTQIGGIVMILGAKNGQQILFDYEGIVDKPGYAGSITPNEALLTNDYWYPMIARKPSPFSISIYGPTTWTAVTHGELLGTSVKGDQRNTVYAMDLPITYWSLNIGPYKTVEEKIGGRTYRSWSRVLSDAQMKLQPKLLPLIIDTYEAFGKFPFSGYGSCMTPLYGGGALEGYSFVTSGYYSGEDSHEVGHTWFGGMVGNTYLNSMWNESFAVWCQGYFGRNAKLGNSTERALAFIMNPSVDDVAYFAAPLNDSPHDIGPAASTLGYGKGAYVLQMLEQELGTETMVAACKDWIQHQDKTRGAEWEDFEAAVKRCTTRDMKWFFDQWVRRPGFPRFKISGVKFENGHIIGNAEFQGAPYRMRCEVLMVVNGGRQFATFELKPGSFSIPVAARPSLVSFDPWLRLLRKIDPGEHPASLSTALPRLKRANALQAESMLAGIGNSSQAIPDGSKAGCFLVGSPELDIRLKPLFERVGFDVKGNTLTYKGTTIDLNKGGAMALLELADGGQCAIGIGHIQHRPDTGNARVAVFDEFGRFLRGVSEPKTSGPLTFRP